MAEITRKRTGELLRKLFEILLQHPDGMQAGEALEALKKSVTLSEYESGFYKSGSQRVEKIVRFATIDCVKAGWLQKEKGRWSITEEGKLAYDRFKEPEAFYRHAVKLYQEWKSKQLPPEVNGENTEESTRKELSITFEQAEEQAWAEIKAYLSSMNPYDFQELVASLLRGRGYHISWVSPPGKDGGIDILAYRDPLGTLQPRIKVQVKRHGASISVDGLRSFMALLGDDDVGLFVSTGGFTWEAEYEARTQEKRKITLINLERLFDLWVEFYNKIDESSRRRLALQPIYFLAPQAS